VKKEPGELSLYGNNAVMNPGSISGEAKDFSLPQRPDLLWGLSSLDIKWVHGVISQRERLLS
jgi:hypothetical protein